MDLPNNHPHAPEALSYGHYVLYSYVLKGSTELHVDEIINILLDVVKQHVRFILECSNLKKGDENYNFRPQQIFFVAKLRIKFT